MAKTIFEATFESALQPVYFPCQGAMLMDKYYGVNHKFMAMVIEEKNQGVWVNWREDLQEVGRILVKKFSEPEFFSRIQGEWLKKISALEKVFLKLSELDLTKLKDGDLVEVRAHHGLVRKMREPT